MKTTDDDDQRLGEFVLGTSRARHVLASSVELLQRHHETLRQEDKSPERHDVDDDVVQGTAVADLIAGVGSDDRQIKDGLCPVP
jgi:hypothetical protein